MIVAIAGWVHGHVPTRERLERSRLLRPFAHLVLRPDLWHLNRRSVQRGVALGVFIGVLVVVPVPFVHFLPAALLAVLFRANVPTALGATLIGVTPISFAWATLAYYLGKWLVHADLRVGAEPVSTDIMTIRHATHLGRLLHALSGMGVDTLVGLLALATVFSTLGYLLTGIIWRWRITRQRRLRLRARQAVLATQ